MKSIFNNPVLVFLIRVFIGGLFITASLDKILDPNAFANSILNYKIVGSALSLLIATILPWLELLCGLGLILDLFPRTNSLIIAFLLAGFTIAVVSALIRGLDISCGCFTQDPSASKIGYQKILENIGLILLSVYLFFTSEHEINLTRIFPTGQNKKSE
jgi:uncharacterized membrane protein YphA (DoxX/SURF4 family)